MHIINHSMSADALAGVFIAKVDDKTTAVALLTPDDAHDFILTMFTDTGITKLEYVTGTVQISLHSLRNARKKNYHSSVK
jgi:hypothetical protein